MRWRTANNRRRERPRYLGWQGLIPGAVLDRAEGFVFHVEDVDGLTKAIYVQHAERLPQ